MVFANLAHALFAANSNPPDASLVVGSSVIKASSECSSMVDFFCQAVASPSSVSWSNRVFSLKVLQCVFCSGM